MDYISREAAIEAVTADNLLAHFDSIEDAIEYRFHRATERVLAGIPAADVVAVVRCRDCVYWRAEDDVCRGIYIDFGTDGFCSGGKRKEEKK